MVNKKAFILAILFFTSYTGSTAILNSILQSPLNFIMNALFPSEAEVAFHASIVVYGIILAFFATLLTAILFLQIPSDKKGVVPISTSIFFFYVLIFQDIPMFTSTLPYRYSYIVPDFIIDVVSLVFYFTITTFVFKRSKES